MRHHLLAQARSRRPRTASARSAPAAKAQVGPIHIVLVGDPALADALQAGEAGVQRDVI